MGVLRIVCAVLCCAILVSAHSVKPLAAANGGSGSASSLSAFSKFYKHCENVDDVFLCIKQQALKLVSRALKLQSIQIVDGVSLLHRDDAPVETGKSASGLPASEDEIRSMSSNAVDSSLWSGASKLLTNFQLQLNLPKVFENSQNEFVEEARKKRKKYLGPFLAAMAIKAGVLKLAYHSIAIVAAKALIIGKIALVISAIIGLKKLVAPEGHEKTTYEIVKHPHVQQSHSYSSSHGEFDGHDGAGQYHRSFGQFEDMLNSPVFRKSS